MCPIRKVRPPTSSGERLEDVLRGIGGKVPEEGAVRPPSPREESGATAGAAAGAPATTAGAVVGAAVAGAVVDKDDERKEKPDAESDREIAATEGEHDDSR